MAKRKIFFRQAATVPSVNGGTDAQMHTKRDLPPIHPGEFLLTEFLEPMGVTQYRLAKDIGVTPRRINEIVHGRRAITADTALRLARFFTMEAEFWLNLRGANAVYLATAALFAAELVTLDREQRERGSSIVQTLTPTGFLSTGGFEA